MKKLLLAVAVASLATGCSLTNQIFKSDVVTVDDYIVTGRSPATGDELASGKNTVEIDKFYLEPCGSLKTIEGKVVSPADLLTLRSSDVAVHKECSLKHEGLVSVVKKAFNIK